MKWFALLCLIYCMVGLCCAVLSGGNIEYRLILCLVDAVSVGFFFALDKYGKF